MRRCGRCGQLKPVEEFAWRRKKKGQRHNYCRSCHSEYHRDHYLAHRQRYIDQAAQHKKTLRLERTVQLIEYFRTHPCVDCGEPDPVLLEFDHIRDESFEIAAKLIDYSWKRSSRRSRNARSSAPTVIGTEPRSEGERSESCWPATDRLPKRATGIEPATGAWKAPVLPTTPRPRAPDDRRRQWPQAVSGVVDCGRHPDLTPDSQLLFESSEA